jgi:hypothetical protein
LEYDSGGSRTVLGSWAEFRLKKNGSTICNFKLSFQKIRTVPLARVRD